MSFDYLTSADEAREAIRDAGKLCSLTWATPPTGNTPDAAPGPTMAASAYGVIFDYPAKEAGMQKDSQIPAGDRQVYLAATNESTGGRLTEIPAEAKIVGPDGKRYRVVSAKPLNPAGVVVLFELQVRK